MVLILLLALNMDISAQASKQKWPDIINKSEPAWFATAEAKAVAENVLLYQRNIGGWPKNIQMQNPLTEVEKQKIIAQKPEHKGNNNRQQGNNTGNVVLVQTVCPILG